MATSITTFLVLLLLKPKLISSATATATATTPMVMDDLIPSKSKDLAVATDEMSRANYFTFVMLINISPLDQRFQENVTFLMPNDRLLSKTRMPQNDVSGFLLRHSIPSPLLFDYLQHIPSGSVIPSSDPYYMLNVYNKGRKNFFLNNVKIISPNLCTAGSSIRCHGIDGVLVAIATEHPLPAAANCSNSTGPSPPPDAVVATPQVPSLDPTQFQSPPPDQEVSPKISGSSRLECLSQRSLEKLLGISVVVLILGFFM